VNMVAPASSVDFTMNAASDGTGVDLTANFTVTATYGGNSVDYTITNNGTAAGYVTKLQARGQAVFDYGAAVAEALDATSISSIGERLLKVDMPYQSDQALAMAAANYFLKLYKDPKTYVDSVSVVGNYSDTLMTAALSVDISSRIALRETVTGLSDVDASGLPVGYFVNGVQLDVGEDNDVMATWAVSPVSAYVAYWLLGLAGFSEIGETTVLGDF
jgi:hypothetical protein